MGHSTAILESEETIKSLERRAALMASPGSPNLSGKTAPTEAQILLQELNSGDSSGYAFMYIMTQFMGRIDDYSTQVQGIAGNDEMYNGLSNDLTKVQQDIQNMSNPPSGATPTSWPTQDQLTAFKNDLAKLNTDLQAAQGHISSDAWNQINNTYQMITNEPIWGSGPGATTVLDMLNDMPQHTPDLQWWFQNLSGGGSGPTEQPALKNWLQNGETITLPNGQTVSALDLGDLGTQVNTVITNTNQELQQYGTEIQQCVQSAQTSNTAVSQEENNYVTNQNKQA